MNFRVDEPGGLIHKISDRVAPIENRLDQHDIKMYLIRLGEHIAMPRSTPLHDRIDDLFVVMKSWPASWAGTTEDEPLGRELVEGMKPFMAFLEQQEFSRKTLRGHLNNLWLIGGETIRNLYQDPTLRNKTPQALLLNSVENGEGPLIQALTESEQNALDATARKLLRFLRP